MCYQLLVRENALYKSKKMFHNDLIKNAHRLVKFRVKDVLNSNYRLQMLDDITV